MPTLTPKPAPPPPPPPPLPPAAAAATGAAGAGAGAAGAADGGGGAAAVAAPPSLPPDIVGEIAAVGEDGGSAFGMCLQCNNHEITNFKKRHAQGITHLDMSVNAWWSMQPCSLELASAFVLGSLCELHQAAT